MGGSILSFNIHGVRVALSSDWEELRHVVAEDFHYFRVPSTGGVDVRLEVRRGAARPAQRSFLGRRVRTRNSSGVDTCGTRELFFFDSVSLWVDFRHESVVIMGEDLDRVREICYLSVLSRAGKLLDRRGLHRVHAMAVHAFDTDFVCMLPSGGGKSTLLLHLLRHPEVSVISDDTPLIDAQGRVHSMPLKLSVCDDQVALLGKTFNNATPQEFRRYSHPWKKYVAVCDFQHRIAHPDRHVKRTIFARGVRHAGEENALFSVPWPSLFHDYFIHGIIGVGTPIFLELFWEFGPRDFLRKSQIFLDRIASFNSFASRTETANFYIGHDPERAAQYLFDELRAAEKRLVR